MSAADEGRTEEATPKKRAKFRQEGSVAKSQELTSFSQFLVAYIVLSSFGSLIVMGLGEIMIHTFTHMEIDPNTDLMPLATLYVGKTILLLLPLFTALIIGAVAIARVQFDFQISWKALQPKWSKVNPFSNFKKVLISKHSLMELGKSLAKLIVMSFLVWIVVKPLISEFLVMYQFTPLQIAMKTWDVAKDIWLLVIVFMGILGVGDFVFQKHQLEEKMKMTKQEVKDEMKQSEPDPAVRGKIFQRGREILASLMQEATTGADVVITNPTHFAVALKYKHGDMGAPKVVAKGMDHLALKMRKLARTNMIPIVENRGLARALYHNTDVGAEIPESLFKPVAEILAFIYKLERERAGA